MKAYSKNYPRPQFARQSWQNLNGVWDFAFDDENSGEKKQWYRFFPKAREITVPFTYETERSGIHEEDIHENVWYRRAFSVGEQDLDGKDLFLRFEGCDYRTKVWVNGNYAGCHTGGYARFSFRITDFVTPGENEMVVKAEDTLDEQQPRGKQRWRKYSYGCWYVQTTGIWKTVWLESVPKNHIESLKMRPDLENRRLELTADVMVRNFAEEFQLEAEVTFRGKPVTVQRARVLNGRLSLSLSVDSTDTDEWGVKIWWPGEPNLYDLRLVLLRGEEKQDEVLSYFGMRDIRVSNGQILLNGVPFYQRLVLDQGYWKETGLTPPDEQAMIDDIDAIQSMGYNGVRKHQKVEDERFLYWCDVKGLLVWSEAPAAYRFSDEAVQSFVTQWMEIVRQNYNHPSIIVWTPFNESWGIREVRTVRAQQHFTEAVYHLTKAFDRDRPAIVNDGWEHTVSDILTIHDYEEQGKVLFGRYQGREDDIAGGRFSPNGSRMPFAQGFARAGLPVIISEFGGIAFDGPTGWGYGHRVADREEFLKRFSDITTAVKKIPYVCGYCYTQLTDVQQEVNGLLDEDHRPKIDCAAIRAINEENRDEGR